MSPDPIRVFLVDDHMMVREGLAALVSRDPQMRVIGQCGDGLKTLKQIDGIRSITYRPVVRRVEMPGPITFARGLEITVLFDEAAFEGQGVFVLGAVLEQFFAKYVSLNSFTETVVATQQRKEIMRWPAQIGRRQIL